MTQAPRVAILEKQGGVLSWHLDLAAGFHTCGADAALPQLRPSSWKEYRTKWRTGSPSLSNPDILARVARTLAAYRPDLVIVLKHASLPAEAMDAWRSALPSRVPFVGWLCDHISTLPSGHVPGFDGVYYFDSATRPMLETTYAGHPSVRLGHLPLAVNPARFPTFPVPFSARRKRLVFVGKNTPSRRAKIDELQAQGCPVDAYGPRAHAPLRPWRKLHANARRQSALYSSYFAALNLLQPPNTIHGLNLRAFEIPAAGGLSTYPLVPDLASAFAIGEEVVAYSGMPELKIRMDELFVNPRRAEEIASAGRARVLREHTFAHRARRILDDWLA